MPEDEVCGICRVQFDGTCPTCKFPGDDCTLCKLLLLGRKPMLMVYSDGKVRSFVPYALPVDLDPTRLIEGAVSDVSTK